MLAVSAKHEGDFSVRIILVSYAAEGFAVLHEACGELGHQPVAYLHARSLRPRGPAREGAGPVAGAIAESVPAGIDLLLPGSTRHLARTLEAYTPDLLVCYGFPWRFPASVLHTPRLGAMNIHQSMLPKHRGPLPIHWAIRNGEPETGVTIHWMDERLDTGNIITQEGGIRLDDDIVPARLWRDVNATIGRILPVALERAAEGFPGEPQNGRLASYAGWMEIEFFFVDWRQSAQRIHHQVRTVRFMSSGARGPRALVEGRWVYVVRTSLEPVDDGIRVDCADAPLWITESTAAPEPTPDESS